MSERNNGGHGGLRISAGASCLVVIDVQEKLIPAVQDGDAVVENVNWLIKIAREVDLPVRLTEQYPRGLGHTVAAVRSLVLDDEVLEKVHFSCMDSDKVRRELKGLGRRQVILTGAETHVCVLQSALQLLEDGYQVYVVADAVSSRRTLDTELALARMQTAGCQIVTREMVAFEWLNCAGTDLFRQVSKKYIR